MRVLLSLVFCFSCITIFAQADSYLTDLAALRAILEKTPAFRDQVKGEKLDAYNKMYARLAADPVSNPRHYRYFYNLAQLLFPLRDNHLGFYQLPMQEFKTEEGVNNYIKSKEFLEYPSYAINIDSLKEALAAKPVESIEGIYHYDKYYSVGLFRIRENEYLGLVTDAATGLWQIGQVAIHLYEYEPNLYKAIYGHPLTKQFIYEGSEKYRYQTLINSYFHGSYSQGIYSKQVRDTDHVNLPRAGERFQLKTISNELQYLLIRTFQANPDATRESDNFYDSIKNAVTAPNLILDLRNNEGGAGKLTRKFYDLVKDFTQKGTVYVLLNNGTLSQAEILTLSLKRLKNVVTVGQTTKGMLAYGSNYGNRNKLPSQQFEIYPTDMRGGLNLLEYEDHGIVPDIFFDDRSDWIGQVKKLILQKSNQ